MRKNTKSQIARYLLLLLLMALCLGFFATWRIQLSRADWLRAPATLVTATATGEEAASLEDLVFNVNYMTEDAVYAGEMRLDAFERFAISYLPGFLRKGLKALGLVRIAELPEGAEDLLGAPERDEEGELKPRNMLSIHRQEHKVIVAYDPADPAQFRLIRLPFITPRYALGLFILSMALLLIYAGWGMPARGRRDHSSSGG